MKIAAVLLVPAEGDPLSLLAEGPCGARAPIAWLEETPSLRRWSPGHPHPLTVEGGAVAARALVLAWDGKPVAEGLDRLVRAGKRASAHPVPPKTPPWTDEHVLADLGGARVCGQSWAEWGLGTLILLDSDGKEIDHD